MAPVLYWPLHLLQRRALLEEASQTHEVKETAVKNAARDPFPPESLPDALPP